MVDRLANGSGGRRPVGMRTAARQAACATGWKGLDAFFAKGESPDGSP
ncbi:MAG: hypothetical protein LBQ79_03895 [Deltaproteobacteria bacterium]|jgi:hypothetical protein|nr:hypothetical protein [Deltaproteobacteria bacterium]